MRRSSASAIPSPGRGHRFEAPPPPAFAALLTWLRAAQGTAGPRTTAGAKIQTWQRARLDGGRRVVAIGGGTGLPVC